MKPGWDFVKLGGARTVAVAALVMVFAPRHVAAQSVACAPSERTVFACATGAKTIAVCASADLTGSSGVVQYRFGRPAVAELVYPPATADWRAVTRAGELMFSGGGGAFMTFTNAPYRYAVYAAVGRGWGSKAGVVVEKGGKRIASLMCKGKVTSELGPGFFSAAGIASGEGSFDLP